MIGSYKRFLSWELWTRVLSVASFVIACWSAERAFSVRQDCLHSSFLAYVQIEGRRIENCRNVSHLQTAPEPLNRLQSLVVRELEDLEALTAVFRPSSPRLEMILPTAWMELERAKRRQLLVGTILKNQNNNTYRSDADVALISEFLSLALIERPSEGTPKFYAALPNEKSLRPLIAHALWRAYDLHSLRGKFEVLGRVTDGSPLPSTPALHDSGVESAVVWFQSVASGAATALGLASSQEGIDALKRALREMDVLAPTRWELTVDLTHTPAWREIVDQLSQRSQLRKKERVLIFTPEGELALPAGTQVNWRPRDVRSQKHVLIACQWPAPGRAVPIEAREIYPEKSCTKLNRVFWD